MEVNILRSRAQQILTIHRDKPERIISHITRVNGISGSSKIIFPKEIIKELNLKWYNDYIEWKVESRGSRKFVTVQKLDR